jgi:hypothetical protein
MFTAFQFQRSKLLEVQNIGERLENTIEQTKNSVLCERVAAAFLEKSP